MAKLWKLGLRITEPRAVRSMIDSIPVSHHTPRGEHDLGAIPGGVYHRLGRGVQPRPRPLQV
jgi:hypothetical protein